MISKKQLSVKKVMDKLLTQYELSDLEIDVLIYIQGTIISRIIESEKLRKRIKPKK